MTYWCYPTLAESLARYGVLSLTHFADLFNPEFVLPFHRAESLQYDQ